MQEIKLFRIKDFVKKKKQEKMNQIGGPIPGNPTSGPGGMGSMPGGLPPFPPLPSSGDGSFDIDQMIKDIDKKIAELEKQEEEEKKKEEAKGKGAVKGGNSKPNIEDEYEIIKPKFLDDTPKQTPEKVVEEAKEKSEDKETPITKQSNDIVDSNLINFDNFSLKEKEPKKEEIETESLVEPKKEETKEKENNYDDFFDDFFYEE